LRPRSGSEPVLDPGELFDERAEFGVVELHHIVL